MELTIIKQNGDAYIDSREVAEYVGKRHNDLLRDIRGYIKVMDRIGVRKIAHSDFFLEATYQSEQNKAMPCFLLTKMGCEMVANKLTGEKGVLFTAAYVIGFNRMERAEHEREIETLKAQAVTPKLAVFNTAVRTVLGGMNLARTSPTAVMNFLRGTYKPFGISVGEYNANSNYYTPTVIAAALSMFSYSGRPHSHAVSAIIDKLDFDPSGHIEIAPYGLVGFSVRYDAVIAQAVADWLERRGFPRNIPHRNFEYHVSYNRETSVFGDCGDCDDDIFTVSDEEIDEMCGKYDDCGNCPYAERCAGDLIRS
jgi:Rha family phage regulatory protein